ncbi:Protein of unknown function [Lachnospiraceae bacterium]|nr:Protein of unknown function [Lachnospiraceae bacterium]
MDKCKVAFIICWKDGRYLQECLKYIDRLYVPENCEIDVITIGEADSIFEAYNAAMHSTDAEYKVYLREYAFIHAVNFISEIVQLFTQSDFNMIGTLNSEEEVGKAIFKEVPLVDGALMVTRKDIEWREDILKGYMYYEQSQCMEFRRRDYKIGAVANPERWYYRAYKPEWPDLNALDNAISFSKEYYPLEEAKNEEKHKLIKRIKELWDKEYPYIKDLLNSGQAEEGIKKLLQFNDVRLFDEKIDSLMMYVDALSIDDGEIDVFKKCADFDEVLDKIAEIRFLIYRVMAGIGEQEFIDEFKNGEITSEVLALVCSNDEKNLNNIKKAISEVLKTNRKERLCWFGACTLYMKETSKNKKELDVYKQYIENNIKEWKHVRDVYFDKYYRNRKLLKWFNGKCAVYTCITGGYDQVKDIKVVNPEWDYICFTDNHDLKSEKWRIVYLDNPDNLSPLQLARRVKILPMEYLSEYDYTIWVDGKIQINGNLEKYIKRYAGDQSMLCFPHPGRNTIEQEAAELIYLNKVNEEVLRKQLEKYAREGFKDVNGLCDTACLVRSNHDEHLRNVMYQWFEEIKSESGRDQMSLGYVCWKNDYSYDICDLVIHTNEYMSTIAHIK